MKSNYKPLIVAVFLAVAGIGLRMYAFSTPGTLKVVSPSDRGTEGTSAGESLASLAHSQVLIGVAEGAQVSNSAVLAQNAGVVTQSDDGTVSGETNDDGFAYGIAAVADPGQPIGPDMDISQNITYTVKAGDTLSKLATKFNISANSIISANSNIHKKTLVVGMTLTIPSASTSTYASAEISAKLPNFNGDFIMPAQGYNLGILQADNSVEIQNSCGTPVIAAADGVVVPDNSVVNTAGNWNDGYGTFILLQHPFGNEVFTRYAHLEQTLVGIGDYVKQGQEIGIMGNTGNASVCSLSFGVVGAQNPFGR